MKAKLFGHFIVFIIKAISRTLKLSLDDRCGLSEELTSENSVIWAFWHSKVFLMPVIHKRFLSKRKGTVLTSPSRDGQIIVEVMKRFGVSAIRGSSNRSPVRALRESIEYLQSNTQSDLAITPDGPRGPSKVLQPGVIKLAQQTGVPIMPISISYSKSIRPNTWDGFEIPMPFSTVTVVLHEFHRISEVITKKELEDLSRDLEKVLKSLP